MYRIPHRIKRKKSIFKNKFFWLIILFLIILGGMVYFLFFSEFFQLKNVIITGTEKVSPGEIKLIVENESETKNLFFKTKSIFLVKEDKIEEIVLDNFPKVAKVNFEKKLPEILEVKIEERKPVAIFSQDEKCFFIDNEGVIFEETSKDNMDFPKIKKSNFQDKLELGERIIEKELISKILNVFSKLEELKIPTKEILIVSDERINVITLDGWEIYFNSKKDINWQLTKLKAVLEKYIPFEKRKDLEYIELRFGDFAPFKYRQF